MNIHNIYTPNQVSKVLGNLSRITLPFWTVCNNDAEDVIPTVKVGNKEITLTDVNEDIINQMTAEEKDIYTQKFQDYYAFMNDWTK